MKIQYIVIMIFGKLLSEFGNVFGVGIKSEHLIDKAEEPYKIGIFFFDKQINPRTRIALAKRFEQGDREAGGVDDAEESRSGKRDETDAVNRHRGGFPSRAHPGEEPEERHQDDGRANTRTLPHDCLSRCAANHDPVRLHSHSLQETSAFSTDISRDGESCPKRCTSS